MARILILAQRSELFAFVEYILSQQGDFVRVVHDPTRASSRITVFLPDLIIVDAASSASGPLKRWVGIRNRHAMRRTPILILGSAPEAGAGGISPMERITYLERPLRPASLITRVLELLGSKVVDEPKPKLQIVVADLVIDPASCRVTRSGRPLSVSLTEFRLLYYLASRPNTICGRDRLRDLVSGSPHSVRAVDVYIRHLRKKIEQDPKKPQFIRGVRGQGYQFQVPTESSSTLL
jgi:two-component system, OmpR family, alkaline phosphatase synthesis response regulator PhoP